MCCHYNTTVQRNGSWEAVGQLKTYARIAVQRPAASSRPLALPSQVESARSIAGLTIAVGVWSLNTPRPRQRGRFPRRPPATLSRS